MRKKIAIDLTTNEICKINWIEDGEAGISYVGGYPYKDGHLVVKIEELLIGGDEEMKKSNDYRQDLLDSIDMLSDVYDEICVCQDRMIDLFIETLEAETGIPKEEIAKQYETVVREIMVKAQRKAQKNVEQAIDDLMKGIKELDMLRAQVNNKYREK